MRSGTRLFVSTLLVLAGCSNDGTPTRTIRLSHITPENAVLLVEPYLQGETLMRMTEDPPALTISAPQERLDEIVQLLARYDVPPPNVRLRFQVIEADGFTATDSAIADVEAALRELFRFQGYRLATETMLAGKAHSFASQRVIGPQNNPMRIAVDIGEVMTVGGGQSVELSVSLDFDGRPFFQTVVTVPDSQTIVLGSARPLPDVPALILVVRPEIE